MKKFSGGGVVFLILWVGGLGVKQYFWERKNHFEDARRRKKAPREAAIPLHVDKTAL